MSQPSTNTTTTDGPAPAPATAIAAATAAASIDPATIDPAGLAPRLRMATMRLARVLRQNADPGMDLSQTMMSALATISRSGQVTLGRLAELESVQPPSMTRVVAKLEERNLVVREVDARDRRIARVSVTPAAAQLLGELRVRRNEYLATRLAALPPADMAALEAALPALERLADVHA